LHKKAWQIEYAIKRIRLTQRGPNTGRCAACRQRTGFVRPPNAFCMPYITHSHKCIVLTTHPLQITHR